MCGISVLINLGSSINLSEHIVKMNSLVRHRGPDDEGYAFFLDSVFTRPTIVGGLDTPLDVLHSGYPYCPQTRENNSLIHPSLLAFGHRRLSICDLSPAGHQPMSYMNGRYWIIFNGEIYNWRELRSELECLGHQFVSQSDTEVILASYSQWGKDCLGKFRGMWAIVIYDIQTRTIFAARDRFGIKPLYYWFSPAGFLSFSSEIKQFSVLPGWNPKLNKSKAYDYLVEGLMDHTEETLFSSVFQIRGGYASEIRIDELSQFLPVYRWYDLHYLPYSGTFEAATKKFRQFFTDSMTLHLRADVPVGSCLSGGLDSSSIVCVANDLLKDKRKEEIQKTFSASSDVKRFDEREFIDEVVKDRQIDSHYTCPSPDHLFEILDDIIWHQDEPFGSTSIFAQWLVFDLAAQNRVKVMLDGQGADEQLAGYHIFFRYRCAELFLCGRWISMLREMIAVKKCFGYGYINSFKGIAGYALLIPMKNIFSNRKRKNSRTPLWMNQEIFDAIPVHYRFDQCQKPIVSWYSYQQLIFTNLPLLLHWEDRNSMAHSVESRVPFLDHRLVEFIFSLPTDFKIRNGCTKIVLRESMRGILPDKIRKRMDKLGFETAEEEWIRSQKTEHFRQLVKEAITQSKGILTEKAVEKLEDVISGKEAYNFVIWRWICFGRWMKRFCVSL